MKFWSLEQNSWICLRWNSFRWANEFYFCVSSYSFTITKIGKVAWEAIIFHFVQNALQWEWGNFPCANWNGIFWGFPLLHLWFIKIHFLPHLESFIWELKFEKRNFKKYPIQPTLGFFPFANFRFQMGVTVMGFAEHFRPSHFSLFWF